MKEIIELKVTVREEVNGLAMVTMGKEDYSKMWELKLTKQLLELTAEALLKTYGDSLVENSARVIACEKLAARDNFPEILMGSIWKFWVEHDYKAEVEVELKLSLGNGANSFRSPHEGGSSLPQ